MNEGFTTLEDLEDVSPVKASFYSEYDNTWKSVDELIDSSVESKITEKFKIQNRFDLCILISIASLWVFCVLDWLK